MSFFASYSKKSKSKTLQVNQLSVKSADANKKLKVMHEDYKSDCYVLWYLPETGKRDDSFVKPPSGNKVFPDWIGGIISPGRLEMGRQEINQKL